MVEARSKKTNIHPEPLVRDNQYEVFKRICEIGKRLIIEPDVEKILISTMDTMIELSSAERGLIMLYDTDGEVLSETTKFISKNDLKKSAFELSNTIINEVRKTGKNVLLRNALDEPSFQKNRNIGSLSNLSVICLPLKFDEKVFGVVYLDNRSAAGVFSKKNFQFINEFSDFISLAAYNALEKSRLKVKIDSLEIELRGKYHFESIVGHHPKMVELLKLLGQVSQIDATVLITGESGTGKELIARAIHFNGHRKQKPFVPINCGAIPENLLESELFGYVRGAFTGAAIDKIGWFERANGGTIFLDEVSEMSPALQVKLLRVLQSGEYNQVGSCTIQYTDVRIIAATNKNLMDLISNEKFRNDLYYRLNIIDIDLHPLRERKSDIPTLIKHFLKDFAKQYKKRNLYLAHKTEDLLLTYDYPGNVRELENIIQRAVALVEDKQIEPRHLPPNVFNPNNVISCENKISNFKFAKNNMLEKFELDYVTECLKTADGNISQAAKVAGIQYANFYKKIKKYDIDPSTFKKNLQNKLSASDGSITPVTKFVFGAANLHRIFDYTEILDSILI